MEEKKEKQNIYDLIILGAGPAGQAAGVYASLKKMSALLIAESFGGQAVVAAKIDNIPGHIFPISGAQLALGFQKQIEKSGLEFVLEKIILTEKKENLFEVKTGSGKIFQSKNILVSLGRHYKNLDIPGEKEFRGKGVAYCSTCDAPLFAGKEVAIIGAGNTAFSSALDLLPYANKIYILTRSENIKADPTIVEKIKKESKVEIIFNAEAKEILGENFVSGLKYWNKKKEKIKELSVGGVFVNIGMTPNSGPVQDLTELNEFGEIKVKSPSGQTSQEGVWAAGDITDLPYKQITTAAGDGIRALLDIYGSLQE